MRYQSLRELIILTIFLSVWFCATPQYSSNWMDDGDYPDAHVANPDYLISQDLNRPIIIACHGFSASTAEWREFKKYAEVHSDAYVQLVLLGGHGRSLKVFKKTTWEDWRTPIEDAIRYYSNKGFKNIHLIGSSAAAPLLLSLSTSEVMRSHSIKSIIFVDPFIIARPKFYSYIDSPLSWIIRDVPVYWGKPKDWRKDFYGHYPIAALKQLKLLTDKTELKLANPLALPEWVSIAVFQSSGDPVSDPQGATLLTQQLTPFPDLYVVESNLHVFTRSVGQDPKEGTPKDAQNQRWAFDEFLKFCKVAQR